MYRFAIDQQQLEDDYPDPIDGAAPPLGMSGYIFFGTNSSFGGNGDSGSGDNNGTLNLDGLPTLYDPSGFNFTDVENATGHFRTPLASFLLCDPQARILDGTVLLSKTENALTVVSRTPVPDGRRPKIGNISPDAANIVLGVGMMDGMEIENGSAIYRVNARAQQALLESSPQNFVAPLPLTDIERNLTKFLNSAAKAFSSYIRDYDEDPSPDTPLFLFSVDGFVQKPKLALVADGGLLISTIALAAFIAILLIAECSGLKVWGVPGFKLESLMKYGHIDGDDSKREK